MIFDLYMFSTATLNQPFKQNKVEQLDEVEILRTTYTSCLQKINCQLRSRDHILEN